MTKTIQAAPQHSQSRESALLALNPLSDYVGLGRSRIYALVKVDKFPQPIKIGKSSRWIKSEVDSWIAEQASARKTEQ